MHAYKCAPLKKLRQKEPDAADGSTAEDIMKVVDICPSGALAYEILGDVKAVDKPKFPAQVVIPEGKEMQVLCHFEAENFDLQQNQKGDRMALCRCGLSKNKPFCDANHEKKENFK